MSDKHLTLAGSWQQESAENLEELLVVLKAGFIVRKAAAKTSPKQTISFEGSSFTVETVTPMKTTTHTMPLDDSAFTSTTMGNEFTGTARISEDGALITEGKMEVGKITTHRQVVDGKMVLITEINDVKCTRVFTRI